jgi:hypothetical protein
MKKPFITALTLGLLGNPIWHTADTGGQLLALAFPGYVEHDPAAAFLVGVG